MRRHCRSAVAKPTYSDFVTADHPRRHDWPILTSGYFGDLRDLRIDRLTHRIALVLAGKYPCPAGGSAIIGAIAGNADASLHHPAVGRRSARRVSPWSSILRSACGTR